ncbi:MAG: hypothetical protein JSS09_04955 [Verrucomicrobia bacterium]|nr:hypothetical protein [Verrucomicrobiota bacterium]
MSFPTVNQTAFVATTATGGLGIYSMVRLSRLTNAKPRSVPGLVAFGALSLLGAAGSAGSVTAWFRSETDTTPKQYLKNAVHDSGVAASGLISMAVQAVFAGVVEGIKGGVRDNIYDGIRGEKKSSEKDS